MQKTSLPQKFFLFFLSIIITVFVLEAGLRLAGSFYTYRQDKANKAKFDEGEVRILCIGESTTAMGSQDSYPSQLEEILNSQGSNRSFKVINKGMISKTSEDILRDLPKNLDLFQPRIVIGMIGVNDFTLLDESGQVDQTKKLLNGFRVYKLFSLLKDHLIHKLGIKKTAIDKTAAVQKELSGLDGLVDNIDSFRDNIIKMENLLIQINEEKRSLKDSKKLNDLLLTEERIYYSLGVLYRRTGNNEKAEINLVKASQGGAELHRVYFELGLISKERGDYEKAALLFQKSLEVSSTKEAMMELARAMNFMDRDEVVMKLFSLVVASKPESARTYAEIGQWFESRKKYSQAEKIYLLGINNKTHDYILHDALGLLYRRVNQLQKAKEHDDKSKEIQKKIFRQVSVTKDNYQAIAGIINREKNMSFIVMQYPLRSVEPLKAYFNSGDDIIFVENKNSFENALKSADYTDYFTDSFAFDFGHCTRKGNRLIAENLAQTIIKKFADEMKR